MLTRLLTYKFLERVSLLLRKKVCETCTFFCAIKFLDSVSLPLIFIMFTVHQDGRAEIFIEAANDSAMSDPVIAIHVGMYFLILLFTFKFHPQIRATLKQWGNIDLINVLSHRLTQALLGKRNEVLGVNITRS